MNIPRKKLFTYVGMAIVGLSVVSLTINAAPPPGRGGGGGKGGGGGGTPPAAITDLTINMSATTHDSITLEWTASGSSGTEGTASAYEVRYLIDEPITDANWDFANWAFTEPAPQASGSAESYIIHRLSGNQNYHIAMKVINDGGNASGLSNSVSEATLIPAIGQWDPELVTQTPRSDHSDFDFDPGDDQASLIYGDGLNDELVFAHFDGMGWNHEVMFNGSGLADLGLQYDPSGLPTVMIQTNGLLFGTRTTDGPMPEWVFETVDSGTVDGIHRPVFNPADNPSVVYQLQNVSGKGKNRTATSSLHYAVRVGGAWQRETIDVSNADHALHASLAYDLGGNAAVSYTWEGTDGVRELKLARRTEPEPGSWVWMSETVQAFPTATPAATSLAFDPDPLSGLPMIALRARLDFSNQDWSLSVARFDGISWQIGLVDPITSGVQDPTILFDATGAPVIAYSRGEDDRITVRLARFNGAAWDIEVVEDNVDPFLPLHMSNVHLRFDAWDDPTIHYNLSHSVTNPSTDELFLTRRVGN